MLRNKLIILLFCTTIALPALAADNARSLIDAGNRQWSEGRTEEAEASFKQAVALNPDSAEAYSRLGSLYLVGNHNDEAIDAYQEAIMRDATDPRLFVAIGVAYLHQGHYQMAQEMAKEALRLDPELAGALKMREYTEARQAALAAAAENSAGVIKPTDHP